MCIDLHLHSIISDGDEPVQEIINGAYRVGLKAIAITDHNEFAIAMPQDFCGMEVIPGCEVSTYYENDLGPYEVHVIGLFFHGVPESFRDYFSYIDRTVYIRTLIDVVNGLGMEVSFQELQERFPETSHYGRSQLAKLMVEKGYGESRDYIMDHYIGNRSPYYVNPVTVVNYKPLAEAVKDIINAGGMPILAHPYHYHFDDAHVEQLVADFAAAADGPLGMEIYYIKYDETQVTKLERLAAQHGLLPSVASDRHKVCQPFSHGSYAILENLKHGLE